MSELKLKHCTEALDKEIVIGSTVTALRERKRFVFHIWDNEYRVQVLKNRPLRWKTIDSGQAVEELLEVYNYL